MNSDLEVSGREMQVNYHRFLRLEYSASQIEELLDKLTASLTGEELQFVETIYHKEMKLQVDLFWSLTNHAKLELFPGALLADVVWQLLNHQKP
ncbi:hypothetical protein L1987_56342 [Smallanthus sonchifolius]|uniref:Uncharacterized protein n=1 Tax=Smallanthus sonchifolius TaxID=185202 RepID=A0ACB9EDJ4_9ASTR|nr:hypothetical protein L1987_56342 [Smallanthus sonchifolius]